MIQKLDPRTRLLFVAVFSIIIFFVDKFLIVVNLMFFIFILRLLLNVPFKEKKSVTALSMLALLIILTQILFFPGEKYILKPLMPVWVPVLGGKGSLKWEGLFFGLMISCRMLTLFFILPIVTKTCSAYQITAALVSFGVNYRAAFIITYAFNFLPVLNEESRAVIDALKLRGVDAFEKGSVFSRLKAYSNLAVPLVLVAMRKAAGSGVAMDSRAFGIYKKRTWINFPVMKARDYIVISLSFIFAAFILFLNFYMMRG